MAAQIAPAEKPGSLQPLMDTNQHYYAVTFSQAAQILFLVLVLVLDPFTSPNLGCGSVALGPFMVFESHPAI